MKRSPFSYAIVEDDIGYREALVARLARIAQLRCNGQWDRPKECLTALKNLTVDVLLVDLRLGKESGVELIRDITRTRREQLIIALTIESGAETVLQAIRAGAVGYLLKQASASEIFTAMQQARAGESPLSGVIARKVLVSLKAPTLQPPEEIVLSRREREILEAMAEGLYYKEVAQRLHLAEGTVRSHIFRIYRKLQVSSRKEALKCINRLKL